MTYTNKKTNKATRTAAEQYAISKKHIHAIIGWIEDELEVHQERAKAEPKNWGYAGDLGSAKENLMNILSQLTGFDNGDIEETLADLDAK